MEIRGRIAGLEDIIERVMDYDRMKNCVNCDHKDVCVVVAQRKANKAGDYSPCPHWKLVEE